MASFGRRFIACCALAWVSISSADSGAADSLAHVVEAGLIHGYPDGALRSDRVITRYEFACAWARLVDMAGLPACDVSTEVLSTDVPDDHWARESIEKLLAVGLLRPSAFHDAEWFDGAAPAWAQSGWLNYRGETALLRRDFAEMVRRTLKLRAQQISERGRQGLPDRAWDLLVDVQERLDRLVSLPPMPFALRAGIFIGFPDRSIRPEEPMTREQFFIAASRLLDSPTLWG